MLLEKYDSGAEGKNKKHCGLFISLEEGIKWVNIGEEDIPDFFFIFGKHDLEIAQGILYDIKNNNPEMKDEEIYNRYQEMLEKLKPGFEKLTKRRSQIVKDFDAAIKKSQSEAYELIDSELKAEILKSQ